VIPIDLLMDFFSRVPATTIARCLCVSKLWESILVRPDFTELFMTMSCARPRLFLFTFQLEKNIFFFSSPQPQKLDDNSSLVLTRYHVHHTHNIFPSKIGSPLGGFFCRLYEKTVFICNPVTGESISLLKTESKSLDVFMKPFLGYDPIDKQFKVLCISIIDASDEHKILTLENGKHLWRDIECIEPHYPKSSGICLDGVLYYTAGVDRKFMVTMIVCFDIRFEKFSFIKIDKDSLMNSSCTLIDYKGKLGALQFTLSYPKRLEFWLLEDAEKCTWSTNIYTFPSFTQNFVNRTGLAIVGMTDSGEVVLSPHVITDPFYIYYYDLKSNGFTRVQIKGLELFKTKRVNISLDYSENLKFM
ncbi:hypothetical protein EUTSA_v10012287mg, partial [Eutrema salsugineum]